ncbi:hypothetical protein BS50DRAFT_261862 [Corynespora cassiicola Philippines]|uniref:Uncharacterized protein n=1 Tax=Corynespora cassiicola Philippines TaxID=1448308 RepID=A0A2T2N2A4_CORCC|nr:hypothetical protein BS50DRAFT_261862 [Corynespora cassiicola Philippines]
MTLACHGLWHLPLPSTSAVIGHLLTRVQPAKPQACHRSSESVTLPGRLCKPQPRHGSAKMGSHTELWGRKTGCTGQEEDADTVSGTQLGAPQNGHTETEVDGSNLGSMALQLNTTRRHETAARNQQYLPSWSYLGH